MITCARCGAENAETAKFCSECGSALVVREPREQRKVVTILFCDVSGSTALGERVDPEALRAIMARYFDVARAAIERHGGTVEKFIGDAVMAVFGVPVVHEDDALRAVRAALELRDAVEIDVRIGVNTGEVVTGGADTLATGDAVNVAARLEQAAGAGEVLIGERTYALVRDVVEAELLPPLQAKGKSQPLTAYRLLTLAGETRRRDAAAMVGRERELELLARAYERTVHEHACHLFTILGTAGIGKSRLVAEFLGGLDRASVVGGRCLSYGEGITYWPVVEVLKQLEVPVESVLHDGTTPAEIAWAVRKALEQAALDRPLVAVFDDIQWGETIFLDLIEHVADLSRGAPILLLCMARPELLDARPGWGGGKLNATSVLLEPLPREAVDELLRALAGDVDERIRDAADGNPLFVEEMVELARASGGEVVVPPTIQALLTARLDSLPASERAVLERGAVEGQVFHRGAVAALAPEESQVDTRLVSLVRKELVRPDRTALVRDDAYRFRHLLIRDAAYEALPKSIRIDLHERFATWLEEHGADLVELEEIVGYHLERAALYAGELGRTALDVAGRAAGRLAAAARRAAARGDTWATHNLASRAVALYDRDDPQRAELLPLLAKAAWDSGHLAEAYPLLDEASAAADPVTSARAAAVRTLILAHRDMSHAEALDSIADAIRRLEPLGDDAALADAYAARAQVLFWRGDIRGVHEAALRAREFARRAGDLLTEINAVHFVLIGLEWADTPRPEVDRFARELLADDAWGAQLHSRALLALARSAISCGRFAEGRALLEELLQRTEEHGLEVYAGAHAMHFAFLDWMQRDWAAMEHEARIGWDRLGRLGETGYRSTVGAMLAVALAELRRDGEAEAVAREALAIGSPDDYVTEIWALAARVRLALNGGDAARAVELADEALAALGDSDDTLNRAAMLIVAVEARSAAGDADGAGATLAAIEALGERQGSAGYAVRARTGLGTLTR